MKNLRLSQVMKDQLAAAYADDNHELIGIKDSTWHALLGRGLAYHGQLKTRVLDKRGHLVRSHGVILTEEGMKVAAELWGEKAPTAEADAEEPKVTLAERLELPDTRTETVLARFESTMDTLTRTSNSASLADLVAYAGKLFRVLMSNGAAKKAPKAFVDVMTDAVLLSNLNQLAETGRRAAAMWEERAEKLAAPAAQEPRPAAEVLAADPIPADTSVLEGMPEGAQDSETLGNAKLFAHDLYVVQIRDGGAWILPNHDDPSEMSRGSVASAVRRVLHRAPSRARVSVDTDGTVYLSDGHQAARYVPVALLSDYVAGQCPGCHTWYSDNGDGPCPATLAQKAPEPVARPDHFIVAETYKGNRTCVWDVRVGNKSVLTVESPQTYGLWDTSKLRTALAQYAGVTEEQIRPVRQRGEAAVAPKRWEIDYPADGQGSQLLLTVE